MASSAKHFFLFLVLITILSSLQTHARDSQFFNKIPTTTAAATTTTTTTAVVPDTKQPLNNQQEEPNFLPSATTNTAAATTQPLHKYLPKTYIPVAYVTEPEDINENYNGGGFRPRGMTERLLENGKYFYGIQKKP